MKPFIIGLALFFVSMVFTIFQQDYNIHQEQTYNVKFTALEAANAASQYIMVDSYKEGKLVFNQIEGTKAAEEIIKSQLKLDENMMPLTGSYWQEQVKYSLEFFDDANAVFPFLYNSKQVPFSLTITNPTVVITIDAGQPRYRVKYSNLSDVTRIAAQEWKGR